MAWLRNINKQKTDTVRISVVFVCHISVFITSIFFPQLSGKDLELTEAVKNSVEANKVKLLHEQIQDRLRHYEAQAQLVETLQKELHSSQVREYVVPTYTGFPYPFHFEIV